jgi:signal transduction histidine kinase
MTDPSSPAQRVAAKNETQATHTLRVQRDLAVAISTAESLHDALGHCLEAAIAVSGMDSGGIYLAADDGSLHLERHHGLGETFVEASRDFASDSRNARVIGGGQAIYTTYRSTAIADESRAQGLAEGLKALGAVPLTHQQRVVGCVNLASHELDAFPPEARIAVEATAPLIGELIVRARLQEDRERLREQLVQAQKMEAIGRLAGGVAHDINNVLTAIAGMVWIIQAECGDAEAVSVSHADVGLIANACERGRALVQDLLSFARRDELEAEPLAANAVVAASEQLLRRTLPPSLRLSTRIEAIDDKILGDGNQLQNVLVNLVLNAADALGGQGEIRLRSANVEVDGEAAVLGHQLDAGSYVLLEVSDDGPGMEPEVLARATEPFFTTKERGKGTGLGLSMAFATIERHGGWLALESELGQGTTVSALLPRPAKSTKTEVTEVTPPMDQPRGVADVPHVVDRGAQRVALVVDDEPDVRTIGERMLARLGYRVLCAASGPEALEIHRAETVDLVLLDLMMPGMDGLEVLAALRKLDAAVRVVLMSGYVAEDRRDQLAAESTAAFLRKPFTLADLEALVS